MNRIERAVRWHLEIGEEGFHFLNFSVSIGGDVRMIYQYSIGSHNAVELTPEQMKRAEETFRTEGLVQAYESEEEGIMGYSRMAPDATADARLIEKILEEIWGLTPDDVLGIEESLPSGKTLPFEED